MLEGDTIRPAINTQTQCFVVSVLTAYESINAPTIIPSGNETLLSKCITKRMYG